VKTRGRGRDDAEARDAIFDLGNETEVVDGRLRAVACAAAEGDLELARQRRSEWVTKELTRDWLSA